MTSIDRRKGLWLLAGAAGLGALPFAARALAPRGDTLALVEKTAGRVAFYDVASGRRIGAVALGVQPHEIAADPQGRFAYVGGYGVEGWKRPGVGGHVVWVIDLQRHSLARTIDLSPLGRLHAVRCDGDGRLYAVSETASLLARFDHPATDEAPTRLIPLGGARSHYLVVRRDGRRAYVADTMSGAVIAVDPGDGAAIPTKRLVGTAPEGLALSRDERTLFVVDRPAGVIHALDADTLAPLRERSMRGEAVRVVTQADGRLIVSNYADHSLSRLDPDTLAEEARLPLPAGAAGLNLPAGASTLYASLANDRVATIDLVAFRVAGGFATGASPDSAVLVKAAAA